MPYKILVVDDEKHIRRLIEVNLAQRGYEIEQAADGIEALEKISDDKFDLIILDVMMPRKDGFETLKEIINNPETMEIPVIMLTAKAQDADVFHGWASGVSAYLTKPFNPKELLTFVERVIQGSQDCGETKETTYEL